MLYWSSFIVYIKKDIYIYIAEDARTRFDTLRYELDRTLFKGINTKVIELMKDKLSGKIIIKFVRRKAKTYSFLLDDSSEDKKAKGTKNCIIKKN